ncbi:hypothetical protein QJS66_01275 [Kocuria rhizophila]|nr:hypothetical protein QJS66_01275 [Kocuria rhizophila]
MSSGTPQGVVSQYGIGIDIGGTGTKGGSWISPPASSWASAPTPHAAPGHPGGGGGRGAPDRGRAAVPAGGPAPDSNVGIWFPAIIKNGVACPPRTWTKLLDQHDVDALMTENWVSRGRGAQRRRRRRSRRGARRRRQGQGGAGHGDDPGTGIGSAMILKRA